MPEPTMTPTMRETASKTPISFFSATPPPLPVAGGAASLSNGIVPEWWKWRRNGVTNQTVFVDYACFQSRESQKNVDASMDLLISYE